MSQKLEGLLWIIACGCVLGFGGLLLLRLAEGLKRRKNKRKRIK